MLYRSSSALAPLKICDWSLRGLPGHPLHPPLTDATIGAYTVATVLAFLCQIGISEGNCTKGWWLALIVGLIVTGPTALTGFLDWLTISWGTPLWFSSGKRRVSPPNALGVE